jgi:hypothetical protein
VKERKISKKIQKKGVNYMNSDTVKLLRECNLGCKYATDEMEQILTFVKNGNLKNSIEINSLKHMEIGENCASLLKGCGKSEREVAPLVIMATRIKNDIKLSLSSSPRTVATIMVKSCGAGTKSVCDALENCPKADKQSVEMAKSIIKVWHDFLKEMIEYY